ncbi:DUF3572 family protein [Aureimonas fodinaquatilis]|uniref:DUF3572 family protein n=1 Tax=Aureimonas fodinaquatilis TaxID=2565783 RepID=A0A5B0DTI5_9HYPH|nr:DUF3572 domain-containing protein [Aureimonas fodinaquatilis]KAA0970127.1 DUF3572 family protein [Aureimonas fodinaquatilis]
MIHSDNSRINTANGAGAQEIGVSALTFLAQDPILLQRFLALSGLTVADLRQAAQEPAFFAGLLDFIMGHEKTLMEFAEFANISPATVGAARATFRQVFGDAE